MGQKELFDKAAFDKLVTDRAFFFAPAFEIYGGVRGLYDYGPPGTALQANIADIWRKHFVIEDDMMELDTTVLTPAAVLQASGHVDKFTDWMSLDVRTKEAHRADHLVKSTLRARLDIHKAGTNLSASSVQRARRKPAAVTRLEDSVVKEYDRILAQIDNFSGAELSELIRIHDIRAPETGNDLTEPEAFSLMFESSIGPTGDQKAYLRPETAQGHFVNFKRLYEYNNKQLPFASAQIGKSFRNEISPRRGLLRVREFLMAEIEHFLDPANKSHKRFHEVSSVTLRLLPSHVQTAGQTDLIDITIGEAVRQGIVNNETLGYYLVRIYQFLVKVGIAVGKLRFRQHMANEMAHYAVDCWDAEIQTSYGWIECVGCADRSAYDLTMHGRRTNRNLIAQEALAQPVGKTVQTIDLDKRKLGPLLKNAFAVAEKGFAEYDQTEVERCKAELRDSSVLKVVVNDQEYHLPADAVAISTRTVKTTTRDFIPNVIEPSFGIGRIQYAVLEHSFWSREEDASRTVLSLNVAVAPFKCSIVPLSAHDSFGPLVRSISRVLRAGGISSRLDSSTASIGKRYARNDELGIPFGITMDFASVKNGTITLRERDSCEQLIGKMEEVLDVVKALCRGDYGWARASDTLAVYEGKQDA